MTSAKSFDRRLVPILAGSTSFVVYARTLLPGLAFGDWGEMQTVPHILGVAHPTGYPTYVVLAWAAQLVPVGSIAFRANLLSAVLVAVTVAVTSLIMLRLDVRPILAITGSLALGAVGTVWAAATVAEVNALHLMLVTLLVHRALIWEARRAPIDLMIGGLLLGLSLGNHLLTLFVAPFVVVFILWVGRHEIAAKPRIILPASGAIVLGLGAYLYIPIAAALDPALAYNHPTTFERIAWLVGGTQFRGQFEFLTADGPGELVAALPRLWGTLGATTTVIVPMLGLAGLILLARTRPSFGLMLVGILTTYLYVWANYLRLEHYLLVPWLILAIGATYGIEILARAILGDAPRRWQRAGSMLIAGLAVLATVALAAATWPRADRSDETGGDEFVRTLFDALPRDAAILTAWDASTPLWHAQFVRGERPDILIVDDTNIVYEGWQTREDRITSLMCDRPVFILRLRDVDLDPTRASYRLDPFIDVRVALGGPTAIVSRSVMRVDPRGCDGL